MTDPHESHEEFSKRIGAEEARKLRARAVKDKGLWFGLGMMGTVGWSVSVPTLVGVMVGRWVDVRWQDTVSWTLTLLLVGLAVGCLNAYYWVRRESGRIHRRSGDD
ncbi:MAG: AtpZ/AtpI family protein [Dehalococcoidia bacterium]|nr:AtpZ/AtpI family protein [Dehalococcoidia bacterium]